MPLDQIDEDNIGDNSEKEMSFLDHLEELRWHLIRSFASIFVFGILIFVFRKFIFTNVFEILLTKDFISYHFINGLSDAFNFFPDENIVIKTIGIEEKFLSAIRLSLLLGFVISFPYIILEVWKFVKPGLYSSEKRAMRGVMFFSSLLFFLGVLFGYFVIAPVAINFLTNFEISEAANVATEVTIDKLVRLVVMLVVPTGIVFQLPLAVYFLSKMGLVTPEGMKKYRRHAIIIILILAAVITPPDVITQFLIGIPLFVLYELSIGISARVIKNQQRADNALANK